MENPGQYQTGTLQALGKQDVSPALVTLLLGATYDILKTYSYLQKPGEFPSGTGLADGRPKREVTVQERGAIF